MGCRGCTAILPSPSDECPQPLFISDPLITGPSSPPAPLCSSQPRVQEVGSPSTLQPAPAPGQRGFLSPATVPGGTVPHRGSPAVPPTRAADGAIGAAPGRPPASPLPSVSLFPTASILVGTGVKNNAALPHGLRGSSQVAITTRGRRACQCRGHRLHRDAKARARRTGREGTAASPSVPGGPQLCAPPGAGHVRRVRIHPQTSRPFRAPRSWRGASTFRSRSCAARNYRAAPFR